MEVLTYWITADALNVFQFALLMEGYDPSDFDDMHFSD